MKRDRFTIFGLTVASLGWIMMIADAVVSPLLVSDGHLAPVASLRSDVFSVAETTIFSGFALAVLGVLRSGFGALNHFFEQVLVRAGGSRPAPAAAVPAYDEAPAVSLEPQTSIPAGAPPRPGAAAVKSGPNYVIRPDGAVEVETLLGTRLFASLDEARGFIRA